MADHTVNLLAAARATWKKIMTDNVGAHPSVAAKLIGTVYGTNESYIDMKVLSGFGLPTFSGEGADPVTDNRLKVGNRSYTPTKFQIAWVQTEEADYKDPNNVISQNAALVAQSMMAGRESRFADTFLNLAFNSSYTPTASDSLSFGNTAHTSTSTGPTYANCSSTTVGSALGPATLNAAKQSVRQQVDGKNIKRIPIQNWNLVVGNGNEYYGSELLNSTQVVDSANNNPNSAKMKIMGELVVVDWWDANSGLSWMLLPADSGRNPLFRVTGLPLDTFVYPRENGSKLFRTREEDIHGAMTAYDTWIDLGA